MVETLCGNILKADSGQGGCNPKKRCLLGETVVRRVVVEKFWYIGSE